MGASSLTIINNSKNYQVWAKNLVLELQGHCEGLCIFSRKPSSYGFDHRIEAGDTKYDGTWDYYMPVSVLLEIEAYPGGTKGIDLTKDGTIELPFKTKQENGVYNFENKTHDAIMNVTVKRTTNDEPVTVTIEDFKL